MGIVIWLAKQAYSAVVWIGSWAIKVAAWSAAHPYLALAGAVVAVSAQQWLTKQEWAGSSVVAGLVSVFGVALVTGAFTGLLLTAGKAAAASILAGAELVGLLGLPGLTPGSLPGSYLYGALPGLY